MVGYVSLDTPLDGYNSQNWTLAKFSSQKSILSLAPTMIHYLHLSNCPLKSGHLLVRWDVCHLIQKDTTLKSGHFNCGCQ